MKLKVDEDLPRAVAEVLKEAGHDVTTVPDQGWSGWTDARIWTGVRADKRILVTADKGFADLRRLKKAKGTCGVVLLRAERESWKQYRSLARTLIASVNLETLVDVVAVVTKKGIRLRHF